LIPAILNIGKKEDYFIVIAGQSNARGTNTGTMPAYLQGPLPNTYIWTSETQQLENIEAGVNNRCTAAGVTGPEMELGYRLSSHYKRDIHIVKEAYGGAALWTPNIDGNLDDNTYNPASTGPNDRWPILKASIESYLSFSTSPKCLGFIWWQGENDSQYVDRSAAYEANMLSLLAEVRASTNEDCPLFDVKLPESIRAWVIGAGGTNATFDAVNTAKYDISLLGEINNLVEIETAEVSGDGVHNTIAGQITVGFNIYEAII
jgi:hypothetical protein